MKFLFIETFYQGSHQRFADGLCACSSHDIELLSMPGENWRWRMLGAALHMADTVPSLGGYDGIIVSDLFNLADFKALVGQPCPPVLVYFHENQITYPQPPGDKGAFQLGIINITTALAADRVVFNSHMHKQSFIDAVPHFLKRGRDFRSMGTARKIEAKSTVLYPGITLPDSGQNKVQRQIDPPLIIWNHRWGYDKNSDLFFEVIQELESKDLNFRLALMGENFGKIPDAFTRAEKQYKDKIVQFGYVHERAVYDNWLKQGALVVSTANQENFGISVVEAMIMGCLPLLPNRLSYPEILPKAYHEHFLYQNKYDLMDKLLAIVKNYGQYEHLRQHLSEEMKSFAWRHLASGYDRTLEMLATRQHGLSYTIRELSHETNEL